MLLEVGIAGITVCLVWRQNVSTDGSDLNGRLKGSGGTLLQSVSGTRGWARLSQPVVLGPYYIHLNSSRHISSKNSAWSLSYALGYCGVFA